MKHFDLKDLDNWFEVDVTEGLVFEAPAGRRKVKFTLNTTGYVEVWADADGEGKGNPVLLGAGEGLLSFAMSINGLTLVTLRCDEGVSLFVNSPAQDHQVRAVAQQVFTTVEPPIRRNKDMDRMMMLMKLNEQKRDRELAQDRAELKELKAKLAKEAADALQEADDTEVVVETDKTTDETTESDTPPDAK